MLMTATSPGPLADLLARPRKVALALAIAFAGATTLQIGGELASVGEPVPWSGLAFGQLLDAALMVVAFMVLVRVVGPTGGRGLPAKRAVVRQAAAVLAASACCVAAFAGVCEIAVALGFADARSTALGMDDALGRVTLLCVAANLISRRPPGVHHAAAPPRRHRGGADVLTFPDGGRMRVQPVAGIRWIDAQGNYARLHVGDGRFMLRMTMAELEGRLGAGFLRVHRTAIVNRDFVRSLEREGGRASLVLADGTRVPVGRTRLDGLRDWIAGRSSPA